MAREQGFSRLAVISTEDYFTLAVRQSLVSHFESQDGLIVFDETVPADLVDFRAPFSKMRARSPEVIVINLGYGQAGQALRRIRESGFTQPVYASYFASQPSEIAAAGAAAESLVMMEIDFRFPRFMELLKESDPAAAPAAITFVCFSASAALYQALATLPPGAAAAQDLHGALRALQQVQMPDGPLSMIERELEYQLRYMVIKEGRPVTLPVP